MPDDIQTGHGPDDPQHQDHLHGLGELEKRRDIGDGAHRRNTGGEDVVHHDGGYRHEGDHGAQDQVGEGIDPAADELVALQDLGDLGEAGAQEPDEQAGDRDKDDGGQADEPVGLGGDVKDGGELVHQGDDPDGQPGEPPAALVVVGQEFPVP